MLAFSAGVALLKAAGDPRGLNAADSLPNSALAVLLAEFEGPRGFWLSSLIRLSVDCNKIKRMS